MTDTICEHCERLKPGWKIQYRCKNHPEKRWFTKNIPARSLFYNLDMDPAMGAECDCPSNLLEHIHHDDPTAQRNKTN